MYKEMIISIIIVALIFFGDFMTQDYTKKSMGELTEKLTTLKNNLIENNKEEANKNVEDISNSLNEIHEKLAYYIEHDEIEKVETDYTACKSFVKTGDYNLAISEINKTIFVLDHITDKYSFNLENIF